MTTHTEKNLEHAAAVEKALLSQGTTLLPILDSDEYPPLSGLEGPFRFADGRVRYYDPVEGAYYDSKTDIYDPSV